ncbi:hypothetical protein FQA39_LY17704 [Lamprigera yunnana]|nr:hypothetical protein FQA39_LY17704 [Lamprigera yunnana]
MFQKKIEEKVFKILPGHKKKLISFTEKCRKKLKNVESERQEVLINKKKTSAFQGNSEGNSKSRFDARLHVLKDKLLKWSRDIHVEYRNESSVKIFCPAKPCRIITNVITDLTKSGLKWILSNFNRHFKSKHFTESEKKPQKHLQTRIQSSMLSFISNNQPDSVKQYSNTPSSSRMSVIKAKSSTYQNKESINVISFLDEDSELTLTNYGNTSPLKSNSSISTENSQAISKWKVHRYSRQSRPQRKLERLFQSEQTTITSFYKILEGINKVIDLNSEITEKPSESINSENRNLPLHIIVSEDQTAIVRRVQYDPKTNKIIGFAPPLSNNTGLPDITKFVVTWAQDIEDAFKNEEICGNVLVVMAQPLAEEHPAFSLLLFASNNKFKAEDVLRRWNYLYQEAKKIGITIEEFSTDDDPRCLKGLKINLQLPSTYLLSRANTFSTMEYLFNLMKMAESSAIADAGNFGMLGNFINLHILMNVFEMTFLHEYSDTDDQNTAQANSIEDYMSESETIEIQDDIFIFSTIDEWKLKQFKVRVTLL